MNMVVNGLTGFTNWFHNMTTTGSTEKGYQKQKNMTASLRGMRQKSHILMLMHLDVDGEGRTGELVRDHRKTTGIQVMTFRHTQKVHPLTALMCM